MLLHNGRCLTALGSRFRHSTRSPSRNLFEPRSNRFDIIDIGKMFNNLYKELINELSRKASNCWTTRINNETTNQSFP